MADYAIHDTTLTGISNVIRKKDGTSALIDPADYPKRINLMGMLEEKTVSSSPIVTFADGADAVPLKKCEITLPASLDGYSAIDVVHCGSNIWDEQWEVGGYNTSTGAKTSATDRIRSKNNIPCKPSTSYCITGGAGGGNVQYWTSSGEFISSEEVSWSLTPKPVITTPNNCYFLTFMSYNNYGNTYNNDIAINYPSSITTYSAYSGTSHTASLGRTIYGGTADIVSGEGVSGYGKVDLGTLTWTKRNTTSGHWRFTTQDVPVIINDDSLHVPDMDCVYTSISPTQSWNGITGVTCNTGISQLMICDETYETASDFTSAVSGVYLAYPLATPETFTFDPISIDSKLGNNTMWAEQGDTEVTYRSMGTVYQYPEGEEVYF